ncbi:MAG: DUF1549 and DUF1553 domain-containing protein [Pirellulaceae bacterium]
MSIRTLLLTLGGLGAACFLASVLGNTARADDQAAAPQELLPVSQRFVPSDISEEPSFQRHVSPLFGRLGCNGRSCHGSFQGRGGFRLSLFGYDFKADHESLTKGDKPRVSMDSPLDSLILSKPTSEELHEGGERYKKESWEYNLFRRWVEGGAKFDAAKDVQKLVRLEVTPSEILFSKSGETVQLRAVAVWPDGMREDVTPLCRFVTNSEQVSKITELGLVTATEPGDTHVVISYDNAVVPVPVIRPVSDKFGDKYPQIATFNKIDELVIEKLRKLGVVPSDLANDAEFFRRVSLDLTGTLPTSAEVEAFLADSSSQKRTAKIDELLSSPAYAAWWTTKLCDYTGNNDRALNNTMPVQGSTAQIWYDWIYKRVAENAPYDKIVEGIVLAKSRKEGQSYAEFCQDMSEIYHPNSEKKFADKESMPYYWARNNLRQPEERAIGFAYTFLGIRIQCAQCHKHPFDQWSKDDFDAFKGFFTRVTFRQNGAADKESQEQYKEILAKLEIPVDKKMGGNDIRRALPEKLKQGLTVPFGELSVTAPNPQARPRPDNGKPNRNRPVPQAKARILGGEDMNLNDVADARTPLMDWLKSKDNPYFAKAFVNRVWANYFNVGIVQPADDLSLANPPSNKPLLDYLAAGFIEHNFDIKWLHREILNSRTYQLTWQPNDTNAKDERNFSRAVPRRLPAEVAYDAVQMATASDAKAATMRSELKGRAISIAGSSAQNGGGNRAGNAGFALTVFGRSIRESNCDCDRSMEASLLQTVFLQNDNQVLSQINGGKETWADDLSKKFRPKLDPAKKAQEIANIGREVAKLNNRIERAVKEDNKEQAERLQTRLAELTKNLDELTIEPKPEPMENAPELVKQVYLRTLSRYPSPDEMNRCTEYLASASSPLEGAKGLLWTLINTKEFIVNH